MVFLSVLPSKFSLRSAATVCLTWVVDKGTTQAIVVNICVYCLSPWNVSSVGAGIPPLLYLETVSNHRKGKYLLNYWMSEYLNE